MARAAGFLPHFRPVPAKRTFGIRAMFRRPPRRRGLDRGGLQPQRLHPQAVARSLWVILSGDRADDLIRPLRQHHQPNETPPGRRDHASSLMDTTNNGGSVGCAPA